MQPGKPNKILTFFLALVPGVGHLYLGAMNRGLQFLILFFGSIFLVDFLQLGFPFWLPIIWFYSLFDALQRTDDYTLYGEIVDKPLIKWESLPGWSKKKNCPAALTTVCSPFPLKWKAGK